MSDPVEDACANCGERIVLVEYIKGVQWMHQPEDVKDRDDMMHLHCKLTVAEPRLLATTITPAQAVQALLERRSDRWTRKDGLEEPSSADDCGSCRACDPGLIVDGKPTGFATRMSVCPDCGNKRCPKAANHAVWQCSGSNAVGQVGVPAEEGTDG